MAFGDTATLQDDFNRADAGDLGANWTEPAFAADSSSNWTIASNRAQPAGGSGVRSSAYYNVATFGPDIEAYWTLGPSIQNNRYTDIYARLNSGSGYCVRFFPANRIQVYRIDSGTFTKLGADITQGITSGDKLGIEIVGNTISVYLWTILGGVWTFIDSRTDSTYSGAGYVGIGSNHTTPGVDDLFAGTLGGGGGPTYTLPLDAGSYSMTGQTTGLLANRVLALDAGAYTVTGLDATFARTYVLSLEAGSYVIGGQDTGLIVSRLLSLNAGSYAVTGNAVSLLANRLLALSAGSYTLSGQDATLLVSRLLGLDAGAYTLTGLDVTLTYNPAGGPTYTLALDKGTYTLTGNATGLVTSRLLQLDAGAYTVAGQDAQLLTNRLLSLAAGSYTMTGQDAALVVSRLLQMGAGSYTLNGFALTLDYSGTVIGAIVEITDAAAFGVELSDSAAYAVVLQDGILYVVELSEELI